MCNQVLKSKAIQIANVFSMQCNKLALLLFKAHTSRFLVTTNRSFAVLREKPLSVLSSELLSYLVCNLTSIPCPCLSSVPHLSDHMLSPTATHAARRFLLPAVQEAAEDSRFEVSLTLSGTFFTLSIYLSIYIYIYRYIYHGDLVFPPFLRPNCSPMVMFTLRLGRYPICGIRSLFQVLKPSHSERKSWIQTRHQMNGFTQMKEDVV